MNDLDVAGTKEISVTFVNGVEDADIWILPQTDESLGTTLWGTPTLKDSVKDTIGTCRVEGGAENYIVRIIDVLDLENIKNKLPKSLSVGSAGVLTQEPVAILCLDYTSSCRKGVVIQNAAPLGSKLVTATDYYRKDKCNKYI